MVETILLVFIFAKIKGVKLKGILRRWEFYPVFLCAIAYIFLQRAVFMGDYRAVAYSVGYKIIYTASLFFLIIKYKIYRSGFIGMGIMGIGMILNQIVERFNNGKMPVFPNLSLRTGYVHLETFSTIDKLHVLGDRSTKLSFLSDKYDFGYCIMSPGDMLVRVFVFIVLYSSFKAYNKKSTT